MKGEPGDSPLTCRCEATQAVNRAGHSRHSPLSISTHKILKPGFMQVPMQGSSWCFFSAAVGGFLRTVLSLPLLDFTHHGTLFFYLSSRFYLVKSSIL